MLAGPGTGKTATLVEAVVDRVTRRGVPAEQILVLTYSRRAAAELAGRLLPRLGLTTRAPMVRTLHSYAFSLVRAEAARNGQPAPQLIAAAQSDQIIRELLAGNLHDGGGPWPEFLQPALALRGFAASVRDFLARGIERGLGPAELLDLGRRRRRPEWVAAGRFARQYSRVLDLQAGTTRQGQPLDQAELVGVALGLLRQDAIAATEQARVRRIFVDEYQDVDPAQAALVDALARGADELIVVGDPDQSIYAFRGSDPTALRDVEVDHTAVLTLGRRMNPVLTAATRRVAALLPGPGAHRALVIAAAENIGGPGPVAAHDGPDADDLARSLDVRVLRTAGTEAMFVADQLRRAHLIGGVPWSEMAVLARSPAAALPTLRRAFAVVGVPLTTTSGVQPMTEDRVVAALLMIIATAIDPASLTGERAAELMTSPIGGLDALGLRRLRRALRLSRAGEGSSVDLMAAVLIGSPAPAELSADLAAAVSAVSRVIDLVRDAAADPAEEVLWRLWQATELEAVLVAAADRGGVAGQRADATLDAVLVFFEVAADRAAHIPGAGLADLLEAVVGNTLHDESTTASATRIDAVSVLSAHSSKGLEWDVVAVVGVQEGSWPNIGTRGDLLGIRDLLDAAAGLPAGHSGAPAAVADERRLFYVAATRARRRLIVTAVADSDTQPSRFLAELAGTADLPTGMPITENGRRRRGLNAAELIADLRRVVVDTTATEEIRQRAAGHLATLAAAGVRGADPDHWWGLEPRSTRESPIDPDGPVSLSPSAVENILRCSLRAVLERVGGRSAPTDHQIEGIVVHALAQGVALKVGREELIEELDDWLSRSGSLTPWQLTRQRNLILRMVTAAEEWYRAHHPPWTLLGAEMRVGAEVPAAEFAVPVVPSESTVGAAAVAGETSAAGPSGVHDYRSELSPEAAARRVQVSGRLDWLSVDEDGRVVVVDFKTTAQPKSKAAVQDNPQLATYQVAVAENPDLPPPGGGRLVYLKKGAAVREQDPLTVEQRAVWIGAIRFAADRLVNAEQVATANSYCDICSVRSSCPLQPDGRQVL